MLAMQASWKAYWVHYSLSHPQFLPWLPCMSCMQDHAIGNYSSKKIYMLCYESTVQEKWGEPKTKTNLSSQQKAIVLFTFEEN